MSERVRLEPPRLEGVVRVAPGRRLGFAEYGDPDGPAVAWFHGTPGGRRQVPVEARTYAADAGLRLIGIDRPGIGRSTPHLHRDVLSFTGDLAALLDARGIDTVRTIGLSGGGPYALAAAVGMPDRVPGVAVLGGVAPTRGVDAIGGGPIQLAVRLAPLLRAARVPVGALLPPLIQLIKPAGGSILDLYAAVQPRGDKELLAIPEFKAMFLDDLIGGTRRSAQAPLADLVLFSRPWGFDLADVAVPVRWWHGDADHIVPLHHGEHCIGRLPDATLSVLPGVSHLGGLSEARDVLKEITDIGG
ncbi:alpha/beta hydrolase [Nocardioides panacisoli]|uniref:alpha/beta fold hydrolase n=1 Tax=Nocardioides panacisoli TaxID=627624 RepID=UPI001C635FBF|nr:alpha/beta hydrolase [Nocardioides panacisoli]QYJ05498.1 alpha/beta hydrolase [Nocardioides panacisoli]